MKCYHCGNDNINNYDIFCHNCGKDLINRCNDKNCKYAFIKIEHTDKYCRLCGSETLFKQKGYINNDSDSKKVVVDNSKNFSPHGNLTINSNFEYNGENRSSCEFFEFKDGIPF